MYTSSCNETKDRGGMRILALLLMLACPTAQAFSESDSVFVEEVPQDSSELQLNMDAVLSRPLLRLGNSPVAIGGYLEVNTSYFGTDGVSERLSFQIPRLTFFLSSTINQRIRFLTEVELEEGGQEIAIEFASIDVEFHPLLNLRGGVIMNPIGAFNQNHDGPKWEFISRPISATTIIPSTWSNVGFGMFGRYARNNWVCAYEAYLTNGFDDRIIANEENRTWLPASKENSERWEESFNGIPLVTLKTAFRHRNIAEIGLSWMGGVYNKFDEDGLVLDIIRRRIDVVAIDFNTTIPSIKTSINGEWVWAMIDVPESYSQQFGEKQRGGFVDIVQPIIKRNMLRWQNATFNLALRLEYVDYNVGTFKETGGNISDDIVAVVPGLSLRPSRQTVFRVNYRYLREQDLLGNPPARTAGFQFGLSTYF